MITQEKDYYRNLYKIQDHNFPLKADLMPSDERIYDIDLNTREVSIPPYLSVQTDHKAETLYFKVDRFFDYMDLAEASCVIQYINALGESHYAVPQYFDIYSLEGEDKMLIPWVIDGAATKAAGEVKFVFRFYKMDSDKHFLYNFTTVPAVGLILHGMDPEEFKPEDSGELFTPDTVLQMEQYIKNMDALIKDNLLYWVEA